jgi:uncharacterized membrane protein
MVKLNKTEFINRLDRALKNVRYEDKKEILADYEEHFAAGADSGKSEDEIAKSLGDPTIIGKLFMADYAIKNVERSKSVDNMFTVIIAIISLSFFNLIFFLPVFMTIVGVSIGIYGAIFGMFVAGCALMFSSIFPPLLTSGWLDALVFTSSDWVMIFFAGLSLASFSGFAAIVFTKLMKYLGILLVKYLKFNLKIINRESV